MNQQTARRVSWSIAVFSVLLVMTGLVISVLALIADGQLVPFSHQFFTPVGTITFGVVGALVASRHPRNPIGWIFCAVGFLSALNMFGAGYAKYDQLAVKSGTLPGADFARWLDTWVWMLNILLPVTFLLLLFPDGHLPSARWRPMAWAAGLGSTALLFGMAFSPVVEDMGQVEPNPFGIPGAADALNALMAVAAPVLLVGVLGSIASVVVRFRHAAGIERAQLKWLVFAGLIVVAGNILGGIAWWVWPDNPALTELYIVITSATIVNITIATGIAILRYRLYDIDIIINRTLVYGSLTAVIVGIYVVIVGVLGTLLQTGGGLPVSLFATSIVAVSFQPLRERLQRAVNRLMFGKRDDPLAVLSDLGKRLEATLGPEALLPNIVETVAKALKLPYAAIEVKQGDTYLLSAVHGKPAAEPLRLPLIHHAEIIGHLVVSPRGRGEALNATDQLVLENVARQASAAVDAVRLTDALQESRQRIVTAREEERRRLRRDLHDGLGPALATLSLQAEAARDLLPASPEKCAALLGEIIGGTQAAIADIRRVAYALRPPALDDLGLVSALKAQAAQYSQNELTITIEAPDTLPALPAAVEVAAYRIAQEALTNVVRHAQARTCCVSLGVNGALTLTIVDDGCGIPDLRRAGVGLNSIHERAAELSGRCRIDSAPDKGTRIQVTLPMTLGS